MSQRKLYITIKAEYHFDPMTTSLDEVRDELQGIKDDIRGYGAITEFNAEFDQPITISKIDID